MVEQEKTDTEAKKKISRGEKLFNWLTYGGIAGIGTFIATIPLAYSIKYGKGSKYFHKAGEALAKTGMDAHHVENALMTTALMQGGNLMLFPVKYAEDHKGELVTKLNEAFGNKTDVCEVEARDKQTWGSIIKARAVAWVVTFASFATAAKVLGGERLAKFDENFSKKLCKVLGKETHVAGAETRAFNYGKIAASDVFATAASSTLLFAGSRVFSRWSKKEKAPFDSPQESPVMPAFTEPLADSLPPAEPSKHISKILDQRKPDAGFAATVSSRSAEPAQIGA